MSKASAHLSDPLIASSHEFYQNPYPLLASLREEAPIFWSEKGEYWLVTRYADAHDILSDLHFEKGRPRWGQLNVIGKLFPGNMLAFGQQSMLNQNPPDHTRLRSLVNKAFTPAMVKQMHDHIEKIANSLLDVVQNKGKMDLIADFAYPLPATVIAEMLGVPTQDQERFKSWSHDITGVLNPTPNLLNLGKMAHAYGELIAYLKPLIDERRKHRKEDLISLLLIAEEEGNHLTESELLANSVLLLIAGHETTANLIGNGTYALLRNPDQLAALKGNMDLLATAVPEFLRYDSPVQLVRRIAGQDLEVAGQQIAAGQQIVILLGAANRDPAAFEAPDCLNISRVNNKHLAFGYGIHHCLGSALAQMEGEIAMRALLSRMPAIKLEAKDPQYKQPFALRGLKELPVSF